METKNTIKASNQEELNKTDELLPDITLAKPELKTYHTLKEEDVKNLEIISDEDFSDIVDSIILNDYKNVPNVIRLPNINAELAEKLGLEKDSAFILKKSATHIRLDRKGNYNQALDTKEYRMIPQVMRNATFALVDKRVKNFQIIFDDENDISKINKIVFNKDELGNYLVTIDKVDRRDSISEKENVVVGVGVAPTISALRFPEELPATRLRPSPTTVDNNISQFIPKVKNENSNIVHSPESEYFNSGNDDFSLTPEQLTKAEQKRDEIVFPILNGKETGMYKAFNDFVKHGVFDVVGTKIDLDDEGKISTTGFEQLHSAMSIYRSKEFETFRYIFIDKNSGEINEQLAISSYMPHACKTSLPDNSTLKQVISRAEETDSLIVAVHNHPSGNVTESIEDVKATKYLEKSFTRTDGLSRFAGHIILDHDTFNLYTPKDGWKMQMDWENVGKEDVFLNKNFPFSEYSVNFTWQLEDIAKKINDTNNWNDNYIPVLFSNQNRISGIKFYDKSFFDNEPQKIRNEFQFSGFEAGATEAFPVITKNFANSMSDVDDFLFEEKLKNLVQNNAFTDAALPKSTITEKYNIMPGKQYFSVSEDNLKKTEIEATWETKINPELFSTKGINRESPTEMMHDSNREENAARFYDKYIEQMQVNGGLSDAVLEAEYDAAERAKQIEELEADEQEESFGLENFSADDIENLKQNSPEAYQSLKNEYEKRTGLSADELDKRMETKDTIKSAESKINDYELHVYWKNKSVEELKKSLKYALNEVAEELPEIDFTRENYNKLFPRNRIETPIETVKIGAHQFEKLEIKDRKNLLQAVHDVLANPDLIIDEKRKSVFGDTENTHVYAKSYVINEKTKAIQSVVVSIEDEYVSITTHKRDISNVVNKIKKPDQLLYAAAKVRLLVEQHMKENLSQSVVNRNRENEYVIPPQTNISQTQGKSINMGKNILPEELKVVKSDIVNEQSKLFIKSSETAYETKKNLDVENPFLNADKNKVKKLYEQAEAIEEMQQKAALNVEFDENGKPYYLKSKQEQEEYLKVKKQRDFLSINHKNFIKNYENILKHKTVNEINKPLTDMIEKTLKTGLTNEQIKKVFSESYKTIKKMEKINTITKGKKR